MFVRKSGRPLGSVLVSKAGAEPKRPEPQKRATRKTAAKKAVKKAVKKASVEAGPTGPHLRYEPAVEPSEPTSEEGQDGDDAVPA